MAKRSGFESIIHDSAVIGKVEVQPVQVEILGT
jgi:hypothetical protein